MMKNKREKGLAINAVLNTIKTVLGIIFPLITFPYVSRVLGVEGIGVYNFSASIVSYFLLTAGLGISTYAIREATQYRDDSEEICKLSAALRKKFCKNENCDKNVILKRLEKLAAPIFYSTQWIL